jgi:type I restriction enzyme, S subunit
VAGRNVDFVNTIPGRCALSVNDPNLPAPRGWAWIKLTEIARLESGHTPSRNHPEYWDGDIAWIGIKDAREHHAGVIDDTLQHVTQAGIDNSAARLLPAKTVCLSRTASVGYVVVMGRPMATSQDFVNWVCTPALEPHYLKWLLLAEGPDGLRKFGKGSTHTTIYFPEVESFHVCVAPLNEQRRIVAKLDAIFEQTRSAKTRLERVPALLEKLKRSILAAAFHGDLTKDWRAAHPNVEPASVLLDRIRTERRVRWQIAELSKFNTKGGYPPNAQWEAKYVEPEHISSIAHLPSVPAGWLWARAEEVCDFITKGTTPASGKMYEGAGSIPFIKVYNLTSNGELDFRVDPTFIDKTTHVGELSRSRVLPGDVLMNIVGPPLGKVSMVPNDHPEWNINQAIAIFRPIPGLLREYLCLALLESGTINRAVRLAKATAGQSNLTLEICRDIPLPLPPEAEQLEIVMRAHAALRRLDEIRKRVASNATCLAALEVRFLAKAFRGELVPQDPNDEPATALLERIRAARAAEPKASKRSRPTRVKEATPMRAEPTNGHATVHRDDPLDLVIAAFQRGEPRLGATQIADATGLDAAAVKRALATLVDSGQVRVHGRARGTTYEWGP